MTLILFIIACWGWFCLVWWDRPVTAFVFAPLAPFTLTLLLLTLCAQRLVERLAEWEDRHDY